MHRIASFCFLTIAAAVGQAADWAEFRGPKRDGVCTETGLLKEWPKEGPPKVWTAKNLGLGFAAPTIADGKIFGMGTRDGKDGVWALKEADGSELWFTPFDDPRKTNQNNGPSGSPTISGGKLYAVSSNGKFVCLDVADGKKVWGVDYVADYGARVPQWGFTDSPLVDGDKVIGIPISSSATIVALNKETGKEIWKSAIPGGAGGGAGYSSAIKATIAGAPQYVLLTGDRGGVIGVGAEDGKLLWQYKDKPAAGGVAQIPIPIINGDLVFVSCSYRGGAALLRIIADSGNFKAEVVKSYDISKLNNHHGGMVQVGDYAYFGHDRNKGLPVCVDLKSGDIKWGPIRTPPGGGGGSAAVLYADGRLYFRYDNGKLVLIEPSPDGLKVVSSFELPELSRLQSWPHPVIANAKLYIRDQEKMHCFDVKAK
ncbi:MAG TPA: PQQ-binding-like beta-propeller repeat protein [Planctomycetia bacterium]|jgi:outer membrane protein assembly factor BamB|nr:PQQ-binding-like beta-propeller repeat protein [Planctomycetia bacterium]